MTEDDAKKLVAMLFAAFPTETVNVTPEAARSTCRVYAKCLADLDLANATQAVEELLKISLRLPTIAAIRAKTTELQHGSRRPGGDAWGDALAAMRRFGAHRSPSADFKLADPIVAKCVDAMGWRDLCLSENQVADRARFIELYDQFATQEYRDAQVSPGARSTTLLPARTGEVHSLGAALKALPGGRP